MEALFEAISMQFQAAPWWVWMLQCAGVATSYVGADLNSRMRVAGFVWWGLSNVVLFVVHVYAGLYVLTVLDVLFLRLNIRGFRHWQAEQGRHLAMVSVAGRA